MGEIAALTAAFLWALSSVIYSIIGQKIPPLYLNFLKGIVAIDLIIATLLLTKSSIPDFTFLPTSLLILSGIIGIGLGDTAYFSALNNLGARKTLLLETLAPPLTGLLGLTLLGEKLSTYAWLGILMVVFGVIWVILERTKNYPNQEKNLALGIIWGVVAALAQAIGAILSRSALLQSDISSLWSALLRIYAGVFSVMIVILLAIYQSPTEHKNLIQQIFSLEAIKAVFVTAVGSTYLGIWLQQFALQQTEAGIAQTLLSTSPLFVLPLVKLRGEAISLRAALGALIAVIGVILLFI